MGNAGLVVIRFCYLIIFIQNSKNQILLSAGFELVHYDQIFSQPFFASFIDNFWLGYLDVGIAKNS